MRLTRNRVKRALKDRCRRHQQPKSTDGPICPCCEPHINETLKRAT